MKINFTRVLPLDIHIRAHYLRADGDALSRVTRYKIAVFIFCILFTNNCLAEMSPESATEKFAAANELYKKGNYAEAAKAYVAVRASGDESGALDRKSGVEG